MFQIYASILSSSICTYEFIYEDNSSGFPYSQKYLEIQQNQWLESTTM